ncbi:unnamed protein product [Musa textilis]
MSNSAMSKMELFWGFLGRCSERSFCSAAVAVFYIFTGKNTPKHGKIGCQGYVQAWASDEWNVERSCCECATTVRESVFCRICIIYIYIYIYIYTERYIEMYHSVYLYRIVPS